MAAQLGLYNIMRNSLLNNFLVIALIVVRFSVGIMPNSINRKKVVRDLSSKFTVLR